MEDKFFCFSCSVKTLKLFQLFVEPSQLLYFKEIETRGPLKKKIKKLVPALLGYGFVSTSGFTTLVAAGKKPRLILNYMDEPFVFDYSEICLFFEPSFDAQKEKILVGQTFVFSSGPFSGIKFVVEKAIGDYCLASFGLKKILVRKADIDHLLVNRAGNAKHFD